jgi:mannonate dehydratase
MMRPNISMVLPEISESKLKLAKQLGVEGIVAGAPREEQGPVWSFDGFLRLRKRIEDAGLRFTVCEGIHIPERVKLGQPGRDEDIANFLQSLSNMARAGVPVLCYNWMVGFGWLRTSVTSRVRGEALSSSYDHALLADAPLLPIGTVSEEQLWASLEYFLRAVVPVAEKLNVQLAMHPDDPPLSPIRGISRIMRSPQAFQRLIDLVPSPVNGLTYCQGCFSEMGADVPATIRHFGGQGKLFFSHFRNVQGPVTNFVETFHDDAGNADMYEAMKAYYDVGFAGPMRPDHAPTMEGEDNNRPGYAILGKMLAIGYMKGLMEAIEKTR